MTEIGIISEPWLNSQPQEDNNSFTVSTLMSSLICKAVLTQNHLQVFFFWIGCFRLSLVLDYLCQVYHKLSGYRMIFLFTVKHLTLLNSVSSYDEGASWLILLLLVSKYPDSGSTILQYSVSLFLFYLHFTATTWVIMTCYSHCLSADKSKDLSSSSI